MWAQFGWHDVKQKYRRSVLGPFWLTISMAIMVTALGFLYARILHEEVSAYLPYFAIGLIVWQFLSAMTNEGCRAFVQGENLIKQVRVPLSVHVLRVLWKNFIIFLHQGVILLVIAVLYGSPWWGQIIAVPLGMLAILFNGIWISILLGATCARFRDVQPIVENFVQILFFVSPIMWKPGVLGNRIWVAEWNPIYHFLELIRAPILAGTVGWNSWLFVAGFTVLGYALAIPLYSRVRGRIPYWV